MERQYAVEEESAPEEHTPERIEEEGRVLPREDEETLKRIEKKLDLLLNATGLEEA